MKPEAVKPGSGKGEGTPGPEQGMPTPSVPVCRRCGAPAPVGDDGFCDKCEKALEQACL